MNSTTITPMSSPICARSFAASFCLRSSRISAACSAALSASAACISIQSFESSEFPDPPSESCTTTIGRQRWGAMTVREQGGAAWTYLRLPGRRLPSICVGRLCAGGQLRRNLSDLAWRLVLSIPLDPVEQVCTRAKAVRKSVMLMYEYCLYLYVIMLHHDRPAWVIITSNGHSPYLRCQHLTSALISLPLAEPAMTTEDARRSSILELSPIRLALSPIRLVGDNLPLLLFVLLATTATYPRCRDPMTEVRVSPSRCRAERTVSDRERGQGCHHQTFSHLVCCSLLPLSHSHSLSLYRR